MSITSAADTRTQAVSPVLSSAIRLLLAPRNVAAAPPPAIRRLSRLRPPDHCAKCTRARPAGAGGRYCNRTVTPPSDPGNLTGIDLAPGRSIAIADGGDGCPRPEPQPEPPLRLPARGQG